MVLMQKKPLNFDDVYDEVNFSLSDWKTHEYIFRGLGSD